MPKRSLKLSLFDAFFFSLMVGAGESYLPAFALSVGMSETLAGLFASVPLIGGAVFQLLTPFIVTRFGSAKKWVVGAGFIQALAFLPLAFYSMLDISHHSQITSVQSYYFLFLIAALYWGAGFAAGPVWNHWMGFLLPHEASSDFFARRTKISQIGILIGIVGGGLALHFKFALGPFTSVFAILFLAAFFSRATSALILSAKYYDSTWLVQSEVQSLGKTVNRFLKDKSFQRFFSFLFFFYAAIMVSSPFVAPFFLAKLKFTYTQFMISLAGLFVAKIFALQLAPKLIKKFSVRFIFLIGIIGISPLPAFWGVNQDFWFVIALQALSGFFWGLFEVGLNVIFFQQLRTHNKIPSLSLYNFFNASATVVGALLGGQILHLMNETFNGYYMIFVLGSFLRLILALVFIYMTRNEKNLL
jgi:MFS family permease